ncbi:unnamed protein product [Prunus armeniaca]
MGEQFGTPSGTSQYTYSDRNFLKYMNIGSSSQNPPSNTMERNQEGLVRPEGPAPIQVPQNQPEPPLIPQLVAPRDQPLAILPKAPVVLPYRPRRMDLNPFPSPARGRKGRGGINPFANNDRNRPGANWRNHPDF